MKKTILLTIALAITITALAQNQSGGANVYTNSADNLLKRDGKLMIGGYGEAHYNQPIEADVSNNGTLDVHRVVMLFGYNFNSKTQFITELEFEHVSEVYVEQAFLQYKLTDYINLRGGLMLIPMGIVNEYHEPTTFFGVERPLVDKSIVPTTWREVGVGVTGNILPINLKYQAYIVNGFNGYDGTSHLGGKDGFRKGRQKGAESYMSTPNLSLKAEYYGIRGLNIGLSGYFGKSQSTLFNGLSKDDNGAIAMADSSVIGISMVGLDTRYSIGGLQLRGQLYYSNITNSNAYNQFTGADLGSSMIGYYVEAAYNVLKSMETEKQLFPFVRYEYLDPQHKVLEELIKNESYQKQAVTTGISFFLTKGAVVKADMQFVRSADTKEFSKTFNAGVGIMF